MALLARILHTLSSKACLKHALDESVWQGKELRCPVCHRLIAYAVPLHGYYGLHVTYRYIDHDLEIYATSPEWMDEPVPKDEPITINWETLRPPIEPLLSDTWDDEKSYQKYVQNYISQARSIEEIEESPPSAADVAE